MTDKDRIKELETALQQILNISIVDLAAIIDVKKIAENALKSKG